MPIYGYACKECAHTLDALQKLSDDPLQDCPACGKPALKRQLSAPRFRLKGKGWYETDFKSEKQRNLAGDAEPARAEGKEAQDAKADAKPDAKPDGKPDAKPDTKPDAKPGTDAPVKAKKAEKTTAKPVAGDTSGTA